jgi:hypothetical protein
MADHPSNRLRKRDAEPQLGDEQVGEWSPRQLAKMDLKFRIAVPRALDRGRESRQAATATHDVARHQ